VGSATTLGTLIASGVISTQSRVVIPVGGMIVYGALQATGLALHRLRADADTARDAIEARLSLGLPSREAFLPHQQSALRTAFLPAIDSTKVAGLISLPGAMAALITARLAEHTLFDHAHRLIPLTPPRRP
jgi:putative ABC transport system permease protein